MTKPKLQVQFFCFSKNMADDIQNTVIFVINFGILAK